MRRYDIADHVSHSAVCVKTAKHIVETPSPPGSFLTTKCDHEISIRIRNLDTYWLWAHLSRAFDSVL